MKLFHNRVPHEEQLRILERALLDGFCCTQFITAMDDSNFSCKLSQVHGFLNSRIAAANHEYFQILEEGSIAGCTVGNALAHELALALAADWPWESAGSDNQGTCLISSVAANQCLYRAFDINADNGIADTLSTELLDLLGHSFNQGRTALAVYHLSGIILNLVCDGNLTAVFSFFNEQRIQTRSSRIDSGCKSARTRTQNDDIINLVHQNISLHIN